jgi:hypothetical protein
VAVLPVLPVLPSPRLQSSLHPLHGHRQTPPRENRQPQLPLLFGTRLWRLVACRDGGERETASIAGMHGRLIELCKPSILTKVSTPLPLKCMASVQCMAWPRACITPRELSAPQWTNSLRGGVACEGLRDGPCTERPQRLRGRHTRALTQPIWIRDRVEVRQSKRLPDNSGLSQTLCLGACRCSSHEHR